MKSGIYLLEFPDGCYVGQSNNVARRLKQHWSKMNEGIHPNRKIRDGVERFGMPRVEILEYCALEDLNAREIYWMDKYDCFPNGYNQKPGGGVAGRDRVVVAEPVDSWLPYTCIFILVMALLGLFFINFGLGCLGVLGFMLFK